MLKKSIYFLLKNQSGQALLVIVLVMVVALTIGLSVVSRTITNLRNTRDQASSQKALSAAEAGVEQAIKNGVAGVPIAGSYSGNTSYTTTIGQVLGTTLLLNGGNAVPKSDAVYVWLYDATGSPPATGPWSGSLTVYWGDNSGDCNNAALEISIISGSKANPAMSRYGVDPCSTRASTNHFTNVSSSVNPPISGVSLNYKYTIPVTITNGFLIRVDPIYANAFIGVTGSVALPSQGKTITSTGTSDVTTKRKVTVYQGYPEIPVEFFPYTLFRP
jgi:Tfp pilus assembly protein PilX